MLAIPRPPQASAGRRKPHPISRIDEKGIAPVSGQPLCTGKRNKYAVAKAFEPIGMADPQAPLAALKESGYRLGRRIIGKVERRDTAGIDAQDAPRIRSSPYVSIMVFDHREGLKPPERRL